MNILYDISVKSPKSFLLAEKTFGLYDTHIIIYFKLISVAVFFLKGRKVNKGKMQDFCIAVCCCMMICPAKKGEHYELWLF